MNQTGNLIVPGSTPSPVENTTAVGLRYIPTGNEGLSHGCFCEGWGAADVTTGVSGYADLDRGGLVNLSNISFVADGTTALSTVDIGTALRVTHSFSPSVSPNLYEIAVTLRNISSSTVHAKYRRVMDWDVEPTAFSEYVTVNGESPSALVFTSNDGFASADPLAGPADLGSTGYFTNAGPDDHGALFDFDFGLLAPGASHTFYLWYGAAGTEAEALTALTAVEAEAYSMAKPGTADGLEGRPNTFIFGFSQTERDDLPPRVQLDRSELVPLQPETSPMEIRHSYNPDYRYRYRLVSAELGQEHILPLSVTGIVTVGGKPMASLLWDGLYELVDMSLRMNERVPVMSGDWVLYVDALLPDGRVSTGQSAPLHVRAYRAPVLYLPGVMGSTLAKCSTSACEGYPQEWELVWPPGPMDLWTLEMLNVNGQIVSKNDIRPKGVLGGIEHIYDVGDSLFDRLRDEGWAEGKNLVIWPYDWRLDLNVTAQNLAQEIDRLRLRGGAPKANLLAHSMGGLIAKLYLLQYGGSDKIDTFITMGTPYLGAPKIFGMMVTGMDTPFPSIWTPELSTERISDTFPSAYQLLPSESYMDEAGGYIEFYQRNSSTGRMEWHTFDALETLQLLEEFPFDGHQLAPSSDTPIAQDPRYRHWGMYVPYAYALHAILDDMPIPNVKRHAIVGTGLGKTVSGIRIQRTFYRTEKVTLKYADGDGTVPLISAKHPGGENLSPWESGYVQIAYIPNVGHALLPGNRDVINYIMSYIGPNATNQIPDGSPISLLPPGTVPRGRAWLADCPVEVHIYDSAGRHTGPRSDGSLERAIPEVDYNVYDGSTLWYLPSTGSYRVEIRGTGTGSMDLEMTEWTGSTATRKAVFNTQPVVSGMVATVEPGPTGGDSVSLSVTDPGQTTPRTVLPAADLTGEANLTPTPPPIATATLSGTAGDNGWYRSDVSVALQAQDQGHGVLNIRYSTDEGANYRVYTEPVLVKEEGTSRLLAGATDLLGTSQESATEVVVHIDRTAPTTTATPDRDPDSANGSYMPPVTIHLKATDQLSGVKEITYRIDNGNSVTVSGALADVRLDQAGTHTITYQAKDVAGNNSSPSTITVTITGLQAPVLSTAASKPMICVPEEVSGGLSWTAVSGAEKYRLYRVTATDTFIVYEGTLQTYSSCLGGTYFVRAVAGGKEGPASNRLSFGTDTPVEQ